MFSSISDDLLVQALDPKSDWKICYLHCPKTAGMSVKTLFDQVYGEEKVFWHNHTLSADDFDSTPNDFFERFKVLGGHLIINRFERFNWTKIIYISVVRDPIARCLSYFNHVKFRDANHPLHSSTINKGMVQSILENSILADEVSNHQCLYLSGKRRFEAVIDRFKGNNFLVGPTNELDFLFKHMGFNLSVPVFNNADSPYFDNLAAEPRLISTLQEMNTEDKLLFDYVSRGG